MVLTNIEHVCCHVGKERDDFQTLLGTALQQSLSGDPADIDVPTVQDLVFDASDQANDINALIAELCCELRNQPIVVDCVEIC